MQNITCIVACLKQLARVRNKHSSIQNIGKLRRKTKAMIE